MAKELNGNDASRDAAAAFDKVLGLRLAERAAELAVGGMQTAITYQPGSHAGEATTGNDVGKSGSLER